MIDVIILGDKYQKGKKSKGCPALITQDKKTIIEHQIDNLNKTLLNYNIHYVSGFEEDKLKLFLDKNKLTHRVNIISNKQFDIFNESYSLALALENIKIRTGVLVLSGYYIPRSYHIKNIEKSIDQSLVFIDHKKTKLGCVVNNHMVENIFFDLDNYIQDMFFIKNSDILKIKKLLITQKYNNAFIFELINSAIDIGCFFYTHQSLNRDITNGKKKNSYI